MNDKDNLGRQSGIGTVKPEESADDMLAGLEAQISSGFGDKLDLKPETVKQPEAEGQVQKDAMRIPGKRKRKQPKVAIIDETKLTMEVAPEDDKPFDLFAPDPKAAAEPESAESEPPEGSKNGEEPPSGEAVEEAGNEEAAEPETSANQEEAEDKAQADRNTEEAAGMELTEEEAVEGSEEETDVGSESKKVSKLQDAIRPKLEAFLEKMGKFKEKLPDIKKRFFKKGEKEPEEENADVSEEGAAQAEDGIGDVPEDFSLDVIDYELEHGNEEDGDWEAPEEAEKLPFFEKINDQIRKRRREQTRLRRENAKLNAKGVDIPYQPMTSIDLKLTLARLGVACAFVILGYVLKKSTAGFAFALLAYLIAMIPILIRVVLNFIKGKYFDEDLLVLIASVGAFILGARIESGVVLIIHGAGKLASDYVLSSTHKSLARPVDLLPEFASVVNMQGDERHVPPSEIEPGELILVRSGERIPIDSVILRGEGTADESALTGNSEQVHLKKDSKVFAGSLYEGSLLLLRSSAKLEDCAVSRVLQIQKQSSEHRAMLETSVVEGTQHFIPLIIVLSVLLAVIPPLFHSSTSISNWTYRALTLLLVCCPAVLAVAVPLSFTSGIGHLSQRGIHAKGSEAVEKMAELRMLVFNKTGTLTEGKLFVKDIQPTKDFTKESCLALAAAAEQKSQNPIAKAIVSAFGSVPQKLAEFEEYPGKGVRARIGNRNLLMGNRKLLVSRGVKGVPDIQGTVVYVSYEGDYAGAIVLEDTVRPEAQEAIEGLRNQGVLRTVVLSGDTEASTQHIADATGIDTVHSGLLPEEKASKLEFLIRTIPTDGTSGYVGDGIKDEEELKQADVGIVMGFSGTKETTDAADLLVMSNDLSKITEALHICRKTHGIALQNMTLTFIAKIILALLTLLGVATMWQAVSADVLITVLTVLNAARILGSK